VTPYLIWSLTSLLLLAGLVGSALPQAPGLPIIFAAALLHGIMTGFHPLGWPTIIAVGVVTALMQVVDYLAGMWGVRRLGGTRWGIIGSALGSLAGIFMGGLLGLVAGGFAGAVLGELLGAGQGLGASFKIGLGSLLGLLAGTLIRVVVAVFLVVLIIVKAV
jgi:uncharacterized protein YqgC (DUF456 family)